MSGTQDVSVGLGARGLLHYDGSPYSYIPAESVAIIFIVLFGIATITHICQAVHYCMWWMFPSVVVCGILEILGWSGRLWSHLNPPAVLPFELQISCTIMGPTPLLGANFIIFGRIIHLLGVEYSRLRPMWYAIMFFSFDSVSLIVQAIGGAKASAAASAGLDPTPGGNIMLGGIAFQLVTIVVYALCAIDFYIRYFWDRPARPSVKVNGAASEGALTPKLVAMSAALLFSTLCLVIRAIYRTIELSNGWTGKIITTQALFNVLDGAMVVLAIYTLIFAHPGFLLGPRNASVTGDSNSTHDISSICPASG